jgi:FkbM family methyltransferase
MAITRAVQKVRKASNVGQALWLGMREGLADHPVILADIGARGGLAKKWAIAHRFGLVIPVLFEPDSVEAALLRQKYGNAVVIEAALGAVRGEGLLNITKDPARSSILLPDIEKLAHIYPSVAEYEIVSRIPIHISRMDEVRHLFPRPDFLKIDTQGFEFEVLQGCGELIDTIVCIEIEVQLVSHYLGQCMFNHIHDYLRDRSFGLVAFRPNGMPSSGIVEANAFFIRRDVDEVTTKKVRFWRALMGIPTHEEYCALAG